MFILQHFILCLYKATFKLICCSFLPYLNKKSTCSYDSHAQERAYALLVVVTNKLQFYVTGVYEYSENVSRKKISNYTQLSILKYTE